MADLEYFTVVSAGLGAIGVDYVDAGVDPDEDVVFAFVDFVPREVAGTVHWLADLDPPRGIVLDPVRGRYSPEDGQLRTIVGHPTNEQQVVTVTGTPFTLTFSGSTTTNIASSADPGAVQAALEALPNIAPGDVYVYRTVTNEKQTISFSGSPTGGSFALAHALHPTVFTTPISRNTGSAALQQALQGLADIGSTGCSVTGPVGGPFVVEFTGSASGINVGMLVANSAGLTPSGTVVITETRAGSSTAPYQVAFTGSLQGTDVPALTGTNVTITTATPGNARLGVELVANTPVLELDELVYDVQISVPDLDPLKVDRVIAPFAIRAPEVGGVTIDLADAWTHLPPKGR